MQLGGCAGTLSSGCLEGMSSWQPAQVLVLWTVALSLASSTNKEISLPAALVLVSVLSEWHSRQALFGLLSAARAGSAVKPRHSASSRSMGRIAAVGASPGSDSLVIRWSGSESASVAIIAAAFDFVTRMFELRSLGRELVQLRAVALRQDRVAGVAVIGFDGTLAVGRLVEAIMAPETPGPVFVADVVRIGLPTGFHLGEEIVLVYLLHGINRGADARVVRVILGQGSGDTLQRLGFVGIGLRQNVNGVGFDEGQPAVNVR